MRSKKGIELSMNFIVIIIISIVLFGMGIVFISRLANQATELKDLTITELDDRIGDLVCESSQRVCIGTDTKTIKRNQIDFFGLKLLNILDKQEFEIRVTRPTPSGYSRTKTEITTDKLIWNPKTRVILIDKNEEREIGIGIQVPPTALTGTYIFNVDILSSFDGTNYVPTQKIYVNVP